MRVYFGYELIVQATIPTTDKIGSFGLMGEKCIFKQLMYEDYEIEREQRIRIESDYWKFLVRDFGSNSPVFHRNRKYMHYGDLVADNLVDGVPAFNKNPKVKPSPLVSESHFSHWFKDTKYNKRIEFTQKWNSNTGRSWTAPVSKIGYCKYWLVYFN